MWIWADNLVIVRPLNIQIYSKPHSSSASPSHLLTIPFEIIAWDATVLYRSTLVASRRWILPSNPIIDKDEKLHFLVTHPGRITLYSLALDAQLLDGQTFTDHLTLQPISHCIWSHQWDKPSWKFIPGVTGHRITWISEGSWTEESDEPPTLFASTLSRGLFDVDEVDNEHNNLVEQAIDIGDAHLLPATWALPKYDFDEALGILAFGNSFGEIALCDYVRTPATDIWSIAHDFSIQDAEGITSLSQVCPSIFITVIST